MTTIRRMTTALVLAIFAPLALTLPAHAADEPTPEPDPLATCQEHLSAWQIEAVYWRGEATAAVDSELRAADRALAAETRAENLAHQLGQRTSERDRLRLLNNRLTAQRNQLQAKVAELRARLQDMPR